jgi:hypothetical protein
LVLCREHAGHFREWCIPCKNLTFIQSLIIMSPLYTERIIRVLRIVNAVLVFVLVFNTILYVATPPPPVHAACSLIADIQSAKASIEGVKASVTNLQSEVTTTLKSTVTAGVSQALSIPSIDLTKVTSLRNFAPQALENLAGTAITDAVRAGQLQLTQLSNAGLLQVTDIQNLANTAFNEALQNGAISLTQVADISKIIPTDLDNILSTAVTDVVAKGTVALNQVASVSLMNVLQRDTLVNTALDELRAKGVSISTNDEARIFSAARAAIDAQTAAFTTDKLKQIVADQVANVQGISVAPVVTATVDNLISKGIITLPVTRQVTSGSSQMVTHTRDSVIAQINSVVTQTLGTGQLGIATIGGVIANQIQSMLGVTIGAAQIINPITTLMTTRTDAVFAGKIEEVLSSSALTDLTRIAGAVDANAISTQLANRVVAVTGVGNISTIANSMLQVNTTNLEQAIRNSALTDVTTKLQNLTGQVDLTKIESTIAGSLASVNGSITNVNQVTSALSGLTSQAFTGAVQGAVEGYIADGLARLPTANVADMQKLIAENLQVTVGAGNLAGLTSSLSGINVNAIAGAAQESIVLNVTQGLGQLPSLNTQQVESLIGTQIQALTGTVDMTAVSAAINDNMSVALGAVAGIQDQMKTALASVADAQAAIAGLQNQVKANVEALAGPTMDALCNSLGQITGAITGMISSVTGALTGAVDAVKGTITNFLTTGNLDLTSLSDAATKVTSSVTDTLSGSSSITSSSSAGSSAAASDTSAGGTGDAGTSSAGGAAGGGGGLPFGGLVTGVTYCTCSFNFAVYFFDLAGGATPGLVWQPGGSVTFANGPPLRSGAWMLGLWSPGLYCWMYAGKTCIPLSPPPIGMMYMVGTSG